MSPLNATSESTLLNVKEILKKYGSPGDATNLSGIDLPYPMALAWDRKKAVNKMACHKLVAANFKKSFEEILEAYGLVAIKELGLDVFWRMF